MSRTSSILSPKEGRKGRSHEDGGQDRIRATVVSTVLSSLLVPSHRPLCPAKVASPAPQAALTRSPLVRCSCCVSASLLALSICLRPPLRLPACLCPCLQLSFLLWSGPPSLPPPFPTATPTNDQVRIRSLAMNSQAGSFKGVLFSIPFMF